MISTNQVKNLQQNRFPALVVNIAVIINAVTLFISGLFPFSTTWGMNHLALYSPVILYVVPLLMLLMLLPAVQHFLAKRVEKLANIFKTQKKIIRHVSIFTALVICAAFFWVGKVATYFLGDGYLIIRSAKAELNDPTLITGAFSREPFVGLIVFKLHNLISTMNVVDPMRLTFLILSISTGVIFIILAWQLTKNISKGYAERVLILLFILASGTSQIYFGYIENYALGYTAIILFIFVSLSYLQGKINIILPVITFFLMIIVHIGTIVFLPACIPILRESFRRKELYKSIIAAFAGIILVAVILFAFDYSMLRLMEAPRKGLGQLVPLNAVSSIYHSYTLFSLGHAIDIFNLLFLIQPTAFVLLLASGRFWRNKVKESGEKLFLVIMMFCSAAFIFLINCELGVSRDWDLLAPFSIVFSIAAIYGWFREIQDALVRRNLFTALTAIALLQTILWIGINADESKALKRLDLIQENPYWSIHAKYNLAEERAIFHRERGEFAKEAMYYEQALILQPSHLRFLINLAAAYIELNDISKSIEVYNRIVASGQANARIHENLGSLYAESQQYDSALHHWYISEALDSTSAVVPLNIGVTIAMFKNSYEKGLNYFLKAIERDSLYAQAYYSAARCYEKIGNLELARKYYGRFNELNKLQR